VSFCRELETYARRIRARAIRREGELLAEIEPATGAHRKRGGPPTLSRQKAAEDAGISRDQRVTALRVANVPQDEFDAAVESDGSGRRGPRGAARDSTMLTVAGAA
jgi:hypothetical protein